MKFFLILCFNSLLDRMKSHMIKSKSSSIRFVILNSLLFFQGCLYVLLGDSTIFIPTKPSWILREKLWPALASITYTTKESIQELIEKISKKIHDHFVSNAIVQTTNETSRNAAMNISHSIDRHERDNSMDIQSYTNLMEILSSFLQNDSL